jgi:hypothetical protein
MASISGSLTLRLVKGSALTYGELDGNFRSASLAIDTLTTNVIYNNRRIEQSQHITGSLKQGATDNTTTGTGSHAEGSGTTASGQYSHAEGYSTTASGNYSHAEGNGTIASGSHSHTEGTNTIASGPYSHAEGGSTTASNIYSHSEGYNTTSSGYGSHAEGTNTIASGSYSHAEGNSTQAIGISSHAEGGGTTASGNYSHTEGNGTKAGITSAFSASVVSGVITLSASYGDVTGQFTAENRLYLYDLFGTYNNSRRIHTISQSYFSGSTNTIVELYNTGENTTAAFVGNLNWLSANGYWNGDQTIPSDYSHAEGLYATVLGLNSHAEGRYTVAAGDYAHTEGNRTQALNDYSHAEGHHTIASASHQHVTGRWNYVGGEPYAFIVGNGTGSGDRRNLINAHNDIVEISGSIHMSGSIGTSTGAIYFGPAIGADGSFRIIYDALNPPSGVPGLRLQKCNSTGNYVTAAFLT